MLGSSLLWRLFSSCGERGLLSGCGVQPSHCSGFSRGGAQALGHVDQYLSLLSSRPLGQKSWHMGLVVLRHICRIFPEQGSNLCVLHWQVDSLPLSPQGSQEFGSYLCISGSSCFNRTAAECPAASERSAVKLICRMRIPPSHPHWHQLPASIYTNTS